MKGKNMKYLNWEIIKEMLGLSRRSSRDTVAVAGRGVRGGLAVWRVSDCDGCGGAA